MAYIVFRHAYRSVEYLKHTKLSASVKAYDKFKEMTGKDIRNFNWYDKMPRDKKNNIIRNSKKYPAFIHQLFQWEHKTTAYQFKEELEAEYKKHKKITTEFIKNLMKKQEMCWITKEENQRLNKKWSKERPQNAYGLLKPPIEIETKPIEIEK
uniref:Uncharacterized protein n=1 Tax=uncultured bacterium contig00046 TaxID=1181532 RepID=A0A806KB17_9BACT|nr:hypothetical protein [uncultured bacterium contig00046]